MITTSTPGDKLKTGAEKINSNFEAVEDEFLLVYTSIASETTAREDAIDDLAESITLDIIPDQLDVLYSPDNYTPTLAATATTAEQLASHIKGIDLKLAALEARLAALEAE